MQKYFLFILIAAQGCSHPYSAIESGQNTEWFIVVPDKLSLAGHERFADELPIFADRATCPGDVVHVLAGDGLTSFTIRVPSADANDLTAGGDTPQEVGRYFLSGVHLEGLDSCHLDLWNLRFRMKDLRETNYQHRVILLGTERPHRDLDYGCDCKHRPHSLLKEYFAERFHPEFGVETNKMIEFEENYGRVGL